jgi:hypothetical protein
VYLCRLRQYRSRISQWGLDKNVKSVEMKAIVRKRQQRRLVEDKGDLRFTVRGTTVEQHKIERWMKLNKVPESFLYVPSPAACKSPSFVHTWLQKLTSASHSIRRGLSDNLRDRISHRKSVVLRSITILFTRDAQTPSSKLYTYRFFLSGAIDRKSRPASKQFICRAEPCSYPSVPPKHEHIRYSILTNGTNPVSCSSTYYGKL